MGTHTPTDYGPIVIVIETPQKFLCMFPDSRSITHASFMGVPSFFWTQWVIEGCKVRFSLLLSEVNLGVTIRIARKFLAMLSDTRSNFCENFKAVSLFF